MALFTYTAINDDNKEVTGSLESADIDSAKKALEDLHLDVKDVHEASRTKPESAPTDLSSKGQQSVTFAFEGTDAAGTVRRGTVQAATKKLAFAHLRDDQKLTLAMLSPVGVLPQYNDPDLKQWQEKKNASPAEPKKPLAFTTPPAPKPTTETAPTRTAPKAESSSYASLTTTIRLYAGWLLAWYGLFIAIGYYATVRELPWEIPFVRAFFVSPLIFSFIIAIFLFLLLSGVHRLLHGRLITGIVLTLVGIGSFVGLRLMI